MPVSYHWFQDNFIKAVSRPIAMELSPCPIFVDAEQCRKIVNVSSYGFVASADISRLSLVVISLTSLAIEEGAGEMLSIIMPEH